MFDSSKFAVKKSLLKMSFQKKGFSQAALIQTTPPNRSIAAKIMLNYRGFGNLGPDLWPPNSVQLKNAEAFIEKDTVSWIEAKHTVIRNATKLTGNQPLTG